MKKHINFGWMLHSFIKGWDLCCQEIGCRNLNNACPNILDGEGMIFFKGNSTIRFD